MNEKTDSVDASALMKRLVDAVDVIEHLYHNSAEPHPRDAKNPLHPHNRARDFLSQYRKDYFNLRSMIS